MNSINLLHFIAMCAMYLLLIGRTIMLAVQGTRVWVLWKSRKGFQSVLGILFMAGMCLWSALIVIKTFGIQVTPVLGALNQQIFNLFPLKIVGLVLMFGGLLIFIASLYAFGSSWRVGIDYNRAGELVTTGVFRISRNPIYLFMDMFFIGSAFVAQSPFFFIVGICMGLGNHAQILEEEKFLAEHYGAEYDEYSRRVRRYI